MGSSCCLTRKKDYIDGDITQESIHVKHHSNLSISKIRKKIIVDDEKKEEPTQEIKESKPKTFSAQEFNSLEGCEEWVRDEETLGYQSIIDLFERYQQESQEAEWKKENLGDAKNIQAWCNYKGSHMNKEYPCLKIHWTFEKPVTADHIIKAMYDNKERMEWDDKVSEIITIKDDHPNLSVVILRNHKVLVVEARQFIEKRVIFKEYEDSQFPNKRSVYVYISSLPDDKLKEYEIKYSDSKTKHVTCATIFTVMKITYDTKLQDGCELVMYTQNDVKLNAFVRAFGIILIHLFCDLIKILIFY